MRRTASLLVGAAAIFGSYMAVIFGLSPAQSFGSGTAATIAFPGLVTGLVATWLLAMEARGAYSANVQLHELKVQLAHREVDLTRVATHDDLTGLYTRSRFDETVALELEPSRRLGRSFAIVLVELDDLETLIASADHVRRGYLLSEIASLLETVLSISDTGARYAEGRFGVLLPDTDAARAHEVAEAIRSQLEHREFYRRGDVVGFTMTASQGIAIFPSPGMSTVRQLEDAAEAALLEARLAGGDTIRIYADAPATPAHEQKALAS